MYFDHVAYCTRAGVFLGYFYFLVFNSVASNSMFNPVTGFSVCWMDRKDFPFASVELLSAGVSCLLVLGKGAAVWRVERLLVRRCSCAKDYRFFI